MGSQDDNQQHQYFEYLEIPLDDDDSRYCRSFSVEEHSSDQVQEFFDRYGFCVFRNVISDKECQETIDDMWQLVEECTPGVDRNNSDTWSNKAWSSFGTPQNTGCTVVFRPSLLRLRQHPNVVQCFAGILRSNDIICSHDRWLMHRPTMVHKKNFRTDWETKPNVHLDLNPNEYFKEKYYGEVMERLGSLNYGSRKNKAFISENNDVHAMMGRTVQGMINLGDLPSTRDGGGTVLVAGSHRGLSEWSKEESAKGTLSAVVGACQYRGFGPEMMSLAQRICMRPGSVLVWDQRVIHGSTTNKSRELRVGVPVRFFYESQLEASPKRAKERANVIKSMIQKEGFEEEVSELGRKVFGLDLVE